MKKIVLTNSFSLIDESLAKEYYHLSNERIARSELFSDDCQKNRFISAEIFTSKLVSQTYDLPYSTFGGSAGEKPYLLDYPDISVSRSYAGNFLAVALENGASIGIDCEEIKKFDSEVIKYFFTDKECQYIKSTPNPELSYALIWTRKESYIKSIGRGLDYPINTLDVTPAEHLTMNTMHSRTTPLFPSNTIINNCFVNNYIVENILVSVCSDNNDTFPAIEIILGGL